MDTIRIPPCSEVFVMANLTDTGGGSTYLVESAGGRAGALVARALVEPKGGKVPVNLLNPRAETVTLQAGVEVATLESVEPPAMAAVTTVDEVPVTTADEIPVYISDAVEIGGGEWGWPHCGGELRSNFLPCHIEV
jgi:hypothetical protein